MNTHNPTDARAWFLAAVERVPRNAVGAVRLSAACVIALPVRRAAIAIFAHGVGLELLAASDQIAEQVEWKQITPITTVLSLPHRGGSRTGWLCS